MSNKLCLTGKKFRGCLGTSVYRSLNGVEIVNGGEIDYIKEEAETFCAKTEIVFGEKLSCNSWELKGSENSKFGENPLSGVARLDKDGTIRLAYCTGIAAVPLDFGFDFVNSFVNAECHVDKQGNLNLKANGTADKSKVFFRNNELLLDVCVNVLQEGCLKRVCK